MLMIPLFIRDERTAVIIRAGREARGRRRRERGTEGKGGGETRESFLSLSLFRFSGSSLIVIKRQNPEVPGSVPSLLSNENP